MIVWAFPNDSDLHHLPAIVDPQQLRRYLPFQALSGDTVDPHPGTDATPDVAMEIVRYKPGKRCTIRYDVCWETGGRKRQWQIFGKMVAGEKGSETYQQMMNLWHRSHVQPDAFGVAQPLGHHAEIRMTWQAALPGVPLSEAMASTHAETLIKAAGKGLADLHRSALVPSARQGIADHLAAAQAETAELAKAYPQFTGVLQTLVTGIEQRMPVLPPDQERPIHRDFHVNQLLVHEGRLFIFDFDDFSMGDPMQDLAFFIVDLHYRDLEPDRVNQIAVAIYQAYQAAADWPAPRERLNWHIQVQFLAKAYWLFKKRQFKAEIGQAIVRTLTLAQQNIMGKAPNGEMR